MNFDNVNLQDVVQGVAALTQDPQQQSRDLATGGVATGVHALFGALDGVDVGNPLLNNLLGEVGKLEGAATHELARASGNLFDDGAARAATEAQPFMPGVQNAVGFTQDVARSLPGMVNSSAQDVYARSLGAMPNPLQLPRGQVMEPFGLNGSFGDGLGQGGGFYQPYNQQPMNYGQNGYNPSDGNGAGRDVVGFDNGTQRGLELPQPQLARGFSGPTGELSPELFESRRASLGHGRFQHPDRQVPSEYLWVPKAQELGSEFVDKVMKHWKLEKPNLLLCCDSGFAHPLHLLGPEVLKEADEGSIQYEKFQAIKGVVDAEFRHQPNLEKTKSKGTVDEESRKEEQKRMDSINKILKRLVFTIIRTIVQVAAQQNIWIVVQGRPTGICVLLQEALQEYSANVVVLVVDCPMKTDNTNLDSKLKFYTKQLKQLKVHAETGEPLGYTERQSRHATEPNSEQKNKRRDKIEANINDVLDAVHDLNETILRNLASMDQPAKPTYQLNADFWSSDSYMKKGWPQQSAKDLEAEQVRWNQWVFPYGTHYLFLDRESASEMDLSLFGPKGCVYLGGGGSTKDAIQESMRLGEPTVLIHNTGRATQQLVILHEQLIEHYKKAKFRRNKLPNDGDQSAWIMELAKKCGVHSPESEIDMSDVVEMNQLYQQRVHIIEQTCVSIDPLDQQTSEQHVLTKVSDCFAANYRISTSVAYEAACRRAVASAWQLHAQLCSSCQLQKTLNDASLWTVLLLGFFALVASILLLEVERGGVVIGDANKEGTFYFILTLLVIILPTLSGLVNTVSSRMRFRETWGLMKSASCLIEAEIFKFRVRVREYAVVGSGKEGSDRQGRERQVRDKFMAKVEQIFQDYLADIGGAALKPAIPISKVPPYAECASVLSLHTQGDFSQTKNLQKAKQQVNMAHAKKFETPRRHSIIEDQTSDPSKERDKDKDKEKEKEKEKDAKVTTDATMSPELGNFSAQRYYKYRMLPTLHTMTVEARRLQSWVNICEVLIGTSAVVGSILGALNTGSNGQTVAFVPLCVSFGAIVTSVMQQDCLYGRLTAINAAVRALSRLDLDWNSASPLEQCSLAKITELVETTENARVSVMNAWTTITASAQSRSKRGEDAEVNDQEQRKLEAVV